MSSKCLLNAIKFINWNLLYIYCLYPLPTEKDIDTRLAKAWTAIDRLSTIWKSDLTDKMNRSFFQAAVMSILLYGCTTWTLTKQMEKKLDGNYTRMLRAILNKPWRQHPTKQQLYGHLPPITKTIKVRRTRHVEHCWRSKDELISDVCGDLGINSKTPNRILTRRLPDTKCINVSPRIRLHASIRLKSEKRKIIKSKVANGKRSRQNQKDFGVANLEPVKRDKYSGFL